MAAQKNHTHNNCATTGLKRIISVLPNDYNVLENIPSINGAKLVGQLSSSDIEVLSSREGNYETTPLTSLAGESYVVIIGGDIPTKMLIRDVIAANTGFAIGDTISPDMAVGTYQFLEIKKE